MEGIPASVGDANMDALDFGFGLLPVVGKLLLTAHSLLGFAQLGSIPLEDVERRVDGSIRKRGEANDTQVDAYGIGLRDRLFYVPFGLPLRLLTVILLTVPNDLPAARTWRRIPPRSLKRSRWPSQG